MRDRFRDLEGPPSIRKKDVVLMATVSSFESLQHPTKSELRLFAELFTPLFHASSDEARRQSVAALSQCANVPQAVALFVGCQPINVAAPFLAGSPSIDDETLITIARTQGAAHAKAIAQRATLSPKVLDALVGIRTVEPARPASEEDPSPVAAASRMPENLEAERAEAERILREEKLRQELKQVARHLAFDANDRLGLRSLSEIQEALLVRFARAHDAGQFTTALADALSSSRWLAERILLDVSGHQLAVTLSGVGMNASEAAFVLESFYPHLAEHRGSASRAWLVLDSLDPDETAARVESWRRADRYTYLSPEQAEPDADRKEERAARQLTSTRKLRANGRQR
ncbi:DUF2336 domain-containing protein [Rhizobium sp. RAF56]|uniref:DUF2336 domain-containing protein n=1 Tax=Rhizobium sp. RAF56 TaxID=3233062 RepID=UPI003F9C67D4